MCLKECPFFSKITPSTFILMLKIPSQEDLGNCDKGKCNEKVFCVPSYINWGDLLLQEAVQLHNMYFIIFHK